MSKVKITIRKMLCPVILLLVLVVAGATCPQIFYLNDDLMIRKILNGTYTGMPDGHAVYMQYPLTGLLALLYRILPIVPWYEVFLIGCVWICMVLIAEQFSNKAVGCLFVTAAFLPFFLYRHYTVIGAVVAGTAVFLLCKGRRPVSSILLLWLAYMIRSQVGLLALPFLAAAMVWQFIGVRKEWKQELVGFGKYAGVLMTGLLLISGINSLCYSSEQWQAYFTYNDARTELYDYTNFFSAEKYTSNYEAFGMTKEESQILTEYYTMLDSSIDSDRLQEIATTITEGMWEELELKGIIQNCLLKYYLEMRFNYKPYNVICVLTYIGLALCALLRKRWKELGFLGVLGLGRSAVWLYLIWRDRFPERVALSLYQIELLLLLAVGMAVLKELCNRSGDKKVWVARGGACVFALMCVVVGMMQYKDTRYKVFRFGYAQDTWQEVRDYCQENPQMTFFWDVFSLSECYDTSDTVKPTNVMMIGGWLTESPLAKARLAALGGADAAEVLYHNPNVRLLANDTYDIAWLQEYFDNRFGDCELVETNHIVGGGRTIIEYQLVAQP